MDNLITRAHLRTILGVSIQTIRNYEKEGMPVVHIGRGRLPRYELDKVMHWISEQDDKGFK